MDQLWLSEKLDLLITPYNCASTWDTGGMIEVCQMLVLPMTMCLHRAPNPALMTCSAFSLALSPH